MDGVITDWRGDGGNPKSCPWVKGLSDASKGQSRMSGMPKLHSAVDDAAVSLLPARPGGKSLSLDMPAEMRTRSKSTPLHELQRWRLTKLDAGLHTPGALSNINSEVPSSASSASSREPSSNGEVQQEDAYCTPFASHSPLAVSNCHMLKFLTESGKVEGRKESGVLRSNAYRASTSMRVPQAAESSRHLLLSAGNNLDANIEPAVASSPSSHPDSPAKVIQTATPHKVAWFDGITNQIAKQEQLAVAGDKHGERLYCWSAFRCIFT